VWRKPREELLDKKKKIFAQKFNMVMVAGWCEDAW